MASALDWSIPSILLQRGQRCYLIMTQRVISSFHIRESGNFWESSLICSISPAQVTEPLHFYHQRNQIRTVFRQSRCLSRVSLRLCCLFQSLRRNLQLMQMRGSDSILQKPGDSNSRHHGNSFCFRRLTLRAR